MNDNEIWKPIEGFEGLYEISSLGGFKSLDRIIICKDGRTLHIKEKITYGCESSKYCMVTLAKNGIQVQQSIHYLVAKAFIPNPNNLHEINHKDENKHNNCVDNLEWCSSSYNKKYGTANKRRIETRNINNGKTSCKPIQQLTLNGDFVAEFESAYEAERKTNINQGNISMCCLGKRKSAGGYIWKFK